jgi:Family of unknown function (DUF6079)
MTIKTLFDPAKDIYRTIEMVITYSASQEARLKAEISEYIATDSIEEQFEKLLTSMQAAMEGGAEKGVSVWVSGWYGSGKSSFTKYLGLALDQNVKVDGVPFLKHLQDRLKRPQTRALLSKVASQYPAAVVLLDLASEMVAGATMEDVSTVLYYKVLQWAGYSRNLKVAAFERRLQKDCRYDEFRDKIRADHNTTWEAIQDDVLVTDSVLPGIAHQMYPNLFKTPTSFSTEAGDYVRFENERVKEMIDIARKATGREHILFIIDEVGQYVGSRSNLILNLDGLAKNMKDVGEGKAWLLCTAQQTLTEDDPRAALNSPELYKLKDRFPLQINLESSDIKEICHRRLLGKSTQGEKALGDLFENHGPALRQSTKLVDARYYDANLNKSTFVDLYPFLPAHFDILLHLLGALAKSTGGIGLRSAIKVIQDVLVEGMHGQPPVADRPVGWLVTTATLYDALERDIHRAFPSIHAAVGKVLIRFPHSPLHQEVGKTVAVLQVLKNLPVKPQNVASLLHPDVKLASRGEEVEAAIKDLIADSIVPFGEKDGNLTFFSEKLNDIDQERAQIPLRTSETRRIFNEALRAALEPLPSTRLHNALSVSTGLKSLSRNLVASLAGDRETIQTVVELVEPKDYDTARARLIEDSRQRSSQYTIYLLGQATPEIDEKLAEIFRCEEIGRRYRNDPDQEVKEYCTSQADRATRVATSLQYLLKQCLAKGAFIFRAQADAVQGLAQDILVAAEKHLAGVAAQVFDRYAEAPVRAETTLAEKFLRAGNLKAVTSAIDPMGLVQVSSGTPNVKTDHKALLSIRDYLERHGTVEGKRLIDDFTGPPFGWSQDTLRYLIAGLLVAGEVKLKVAGREVLVNGQQAIEALRTNTVFKSIGVTLRGEGKPSNEVLARAAQRLRDLLGEDVIPLEDEISKTAVKHLPQLQQRFGPLAEKLDALGLPGSDTMRSLGQDITDLLLTDASDAPKRLGSETSSFYEGLQRASQVERALKQGLEETVRALQEHRKEIEALPASGVPAELCEQVEEELSLVGERLGQDDWYRHDSELRSALTSLKARTRDAAVQMADAQRAKIKEAEADLQRLPEWGELTQEEQSQSLSSIEGLVLTTSDDLRGLKQLLGQEFVISSQSSAIKKQIEQRGRQRQRQRLEEEKARAEQEGRARLTRSLKVPALLTSTGELDALIQQLQALRGELALSDDIEVRIEVEG